MKILNFPFWKSRDNSCQQAPEEPFKPSALVITCYARDIEKYGQPMDSGLPEYFRKVADYYESKGDVK